MNPKKVIAYIKNNNNFVITSHTNLEGDALGSELAFYRLLKMMGKRATIINEDNYPPRYGFLPDINEIKKFNKKNIRGLAIGCLAVLDCSDLKRCGEVSKINTDNKPVINIDHHISNRDFGDINWIDCNASSCCEMIYKLYKESRLPLDKETAVLLYVGIVTDTGSFRYSNTSSLTHRLAAEFLKHKIDVAQIYKYVYEGIPFSEIRLLSNILGRLKCQFHSKIAWLDIDQNLFKNKKISIDLSEQILNFMRAIKGVQVAVLFKENLGKKNEVRINLRSQGSPDVNKIACFFGGGGHKTASGATVQGKIDEVRRKVLVKIKESLI